MKINVDIMTKSMLYVAFAIVATIVNLFTQEITSTLFQYEYEIIVSMFTGTLAWLLSIY